MRKSYISPEFFNRRVSGTLSVLEESNFFGSKMLEIEDLISLENQRIVYYQKSNKEQSNFQAEFNISPITYSISDDKKNNHSLEIDTLQSRYQRDSNTKWNININVREILINYLFATLKQYRTFEGIRNDMTIYNNIDVAIRNYIITNVINRYTLKSIDFFISYNDLRSQNSLRFKNNWPNIENVDFITTEDNKVKKIQIITTNDNEFTKISFNQEKPSTKFNFDYYYNLIFEKI
jgi:hypothetical protein